MKSPTWATGRLRRETRDDARAGRRGEPERRLAAVCAAAARAPQRQASLPAAGRAGRWPRIRAPRRAAGALGRAGQGAPARDAHRRHHALDIDRPPGPGLRRSRLHRGGGPPARPSPGQAGLHPRPPPVRGHGPGGLAQAGDRGLPARPHRSGRRAGGRTPARALCAGRGGGRSGVAAAVRPDPEVDGRSRRLRGGALARPVHAARGRGRRAPARDDHRRRSRPPRPQPRDLRLPGGAEDGRQLGRGGRQDRA